METKVCKYCGEERPLEAFSFEKGYRRHKCNPCRNEPKSAWRKNNREKMNGYSKKYRDSNPSKIRDSNYKRYYGISLEDYERMYREQDGRCLICRDQFEQLVVDHSHGTGEVRGLLCSPCNTAIGLMRESPDRLLSAAEYVSRQ